MARTLSSIRVTVLKGEVKDADVMGKSDPYVVLTVDGVKKQTRVIENTLKPEWNEVLELPVKSADSVLEIAAFDQDVGKDDSLGTGVLQLKQLVAEGSDGTFRNVRIPLEIKGKKEGWVELTVVANWKTEQDFATAKDQLLSVLLTVHSGRGMLKTDIITKPDPYVVVRTLPSGHGDVFTTSIQKNTSEPLWKESHEFNTKGETDFKIEVYDKDMVGKDLIGEIQVPFRELGLYRGAGNRWIPIFNKKKNAGEILIHYVPELTSPAGAATKPESPRDADPPKVFEYPKPTGSPAASSSPPKEAVSKELQASPVHSQKSPTGSSAHGSPAGGSKYPPVPPTGICAVKVTVVEGHALKAKDVMGKAEAYVLTRCGGNSFKTRAEKVPDPQWGDSHIFDLETHPGANIEFDVLDKDTIGQDDPIGRTSIPVASISKPESRKIPIYNNGQMAGGVKIEFAPLFDRPRGGSALESLAAITVTVKEAKDLPSEGGILGSVGKVDPYVKVMTLREKWQTTAKKNTHNPQWEETHSFEMLAQPSLKFEIMDKDLLADDALCHTEIQVRDFPLTGGPVTKWFPCFKKDGKPGGELHLCLIPRFADTLDASSPKRGLPAQGFTPAPAVVQPSAPHALTTVSPRHQAPPVAPAMPPPHVPPAAPNVEGPNPKHQKIDDLRRQIEEQRRKNEELQKYHNNETIRLRNDLADQKEELRRSLENIRHEITRRERLSQQQSPPRSPSPSRVAPHAGYYPSTYVPPAYYSSPPRYYGPEGSYPSAPFYPEGLPPHTSYALPPTYTAARPSYNPPYVPSTYTAPIAPYQSSYVPPTYLQESTAAGLYGPARELPYGASYGAPSRLPPYSGATYY